MRVKYRGFEGEVWYEDGGWCANMRNKLVEIPLRNFSALHTGNVVSRIQCLVNDYYIAQKDAEENHAK